MKLVDALYDDPRKALHSVFASAGYTLPARDGLVAYELDVPGDVERARKVHGLQLSVKKGEGNVLLIHQDLRVPKLRVVLKGSKNLCVFGPNVRAEGAVELRHNQCKVVVSGGRYTRRVRLNLTLQASGQRVFVGQDTSAGGLACSMRGAGAALIIGDDCMLSWHVWFRPSDMHAIVDLESGRMINRAQDIIVEPHVWIGQEALIMKGALIGAGSVVGARSIVLGGSHPRMSVLAGMPARVVRSGVSWTREHDGVESVMANRVREITARYPVAPEQPGDITLARRTQGLGAAWRRMRKFVRSPEKALRDSRYAAPRALGAWLMKAKRTSR